jgi:DNA helicase-2/ATP-dependent DNA helicase PcrA
VDVDALLEGLDPDQRAAVLSDAAPLCIVAPAGSGKTRVLTQRIARRLEDGSADAGHVLVLTFTRRAAGELTDRLRRLGIRESVAAGTFHGIAHRFLRQRWEDQHRRAPRLLVSRIGLVRELAPTARSRRAGTSTAQSITTEIDWARSRGMRPDDYLVAAARAGRRTGLDLEEVADVFERYEATKRERRLIDFDDVLALLHREIDRDPAYAAATRWRVRHLFVDEFQDVNPLQHALLEAWRGGRDDLCVVGDPSQAIYGWNGADGRWLTQFDRLHPGGTVVRLRSSHRSTPQIVSFAHAVLPDEAAAPAATRADGPLPSAHRFADASQEARGVAGLVRDLRPPGGRWSSIAVLARTNAQLEPIADALATAGIPARRRDRTDRDPSAAGALAELRTVTGRGSLRAWVDEVAGGTEGDEAAPIVAVPRWLLEAASDLLEQDPTADGAALRHWLSTGGGDDGLRPGEDAVALLTFHAAKGLEWSSVVVIGLVPGVTPHTSARAAAAKDEERRLFHVAATRAAHQLHLTWYGTRRSPFLDPLDLAHEPTTEAPPDLRPRRAEAPADPVLVALESWRRGAARAARVDERTVVDDPTLAAIAAARPKTVEALGEVSGFGPLMARRHGARLLAAIRPALAPST